MRETVMSRRTLLGAGACAVGCSVGHQNLPVRMPRQG